MTGITDPAEAYFKDGTWGWDGTQWRKLPLVWGYSDRLAVETTHTKSGGGDHVMSVCTPAEGEIFVIQACSSRNNTTAIIRNVYLYDGSKYHLIDRSAAVTANSYHLTTQIHYVLKYGDSLRIEFPACVDGDVLTGHAWGYKMKVAE